MASVSSFQHWTHRSLLYPLLVRSAARHSSSPITTRWFAAGGMSRLLDYGGAPAAWNDPKPVHRVENASKNCHVQAVCFDFDVLTRAVDSSRISKAGDSTSDTTSRPRLGTVQPNVSAIRQVANLLNVDWGSSDTANDNRTTNDNSSNTVANTGQLATLAPVRPKVRDFSPGASDVRAKYADKLSQKGVGGGLATVDLAKYQVQQNAHQGDAAGHWAARERAVTEPGPNSATRWMALTGTGGLLQYLTKRSMKIALFPRLGNTVPDSQEGERMEDFKRQLNEVVFDLLLKDGTQEPSVIVQEMLGQFQLDPKFILVVSDRDAYLRAAKDAGMVACRVRPENAPRGNRYPKWKTSLTKSMAFPLVPF
ncbi:predicted protein [Phaeodactylum tricornutum CCAP 1055/1]|uniref:Uncharacterized protein n=2 Tax=Phaeodactylum tricornutum TaxID=2850 RepID=B7G6Y4_PHATC|nr:predicted protein [Phaeodactylum tricornutum CCAP 1055/1]EEC45674.1 predicted protein [Phaeodactylum tricornutum CCAP 1055/1]|eukprot:XP_002182938.1 predicted protein [Phaeodactylum tricornutum CCAP 1055/1]